VLKLRFYQSAQLEQDVWRLRDEFAIHLAASVAEPGAPVLDQAPRPPRLGLLLGNERAGLSPALVEGSQSRWTIPMQLQTDSLNVAVASGIFLYHFSKPTGDAPGR
jgi:tRNA G18 (ribose-2'-O)-methylase SpoU